MPLKAYMLLALMNKLNKMQSKYVMLVNKLLMALRFALLASAWLAFSLLVQHESAKKVS